MIETIEFKGHVYPKFTSTGGAAVYVREIAKEVCKGHGLDIGYSKEEWMFPGAIGIDPAKDPTFHAMHLPEGQFDYLHSSHALEHVETSPWKCLDYWASKLKTGGTLFLFLPDFSQVYHRPWHNTKHNHVFTPTIVEFYLKECGFFKNVFVSGVDIYNGFIAMAEKI